MVNIYLDPILLQWGPITVSWHGLCLVVGIVVSYLVIVREGTRKGFSRPALSKLALWLAVPGLAGARLLYTLEHWHLYAADPLRILALHQGGSTIRGGIVGGVLAAFFYARWTQLSFWKLVDVVAIALPLGSVVGRLGCTINGDVWGMPTDGSWGLVYWHSDAAIPPELLGVPTFPAPTILQLWNLGIFALLLALRGRAAYDGFLATVYLIVYALGRFIISTWQAGEIVLLGLKSTQITALGMLILGLVLMIYLPPKQQGVCFDGANQPVGGEGLSVLPDVPSPGLVKATTNIGGSCMASKTIDLYLQVGGGPGADEEDLEELAQHLTDELNELDGIEAVERVQEGKLPEDAKGLLIPAGTLLIKFAETAGVTALINVLGSWLSSDRSRTLKLKLGDATLELTGLSKPEQQELIDWFQGQAGIRLDG
ncbi:MAG: hypothetical protein Kow0063_04340 [Anaerolineae bacterium]